MSGEHSGETISGEQLKRLCINLLAEAPEILKGRDESNPKMDRVRPPPGLLLRAFVEGRRRGVGPARPTRIRPRAELEL